MGTVVGTVVGTVRALCGHCAGTVRSIGVPYRP